MLVLRKTRQTVHCGRKPAGSVSNGGVDMIAGYRSSRPRLICLTISLCLYVFVPTWVAFPKEKEKRPSERFQATIGHPAGPPGGGPGRISITIEEHTTQEEFSRLADAFKAGGPKAFLKAVRRMKKGFLQVEYDMSHPLRVVDSRATEKGRRILVVAEHEQSLSELGDRNVSSDYPYTCVELVVDANGKGEGIFMPLAKVYFAEDHTLTVENYSIKNLTLRDVRPDE